MERTETFQYKRGGKAVAESFVSLADAYSGYDQEDFDFTDYSEVSEDDDEIFVEAITNADAKKMSVRFGSVRVQTHEVVLGDVRQNRSIKIL